MKFSRIISLSSLPDDMDTILSQFLGEFVWTGRQAEHLMSDYWNGIPEDRFALERLEIPMPEKLNLYWSPVLSLWHQIRNEEWDDRGPEHVANFVRSMSNSEPIPPIIVRSDEFFDGRHRLWAAKTLGTDFLEAIDLNDFLPKSKLQ